MRKMLATATIAVLLLSACNKNTQDVAIHAEGTSADPLRTTAEINAFIKKTIEEKGSFDWKDAPEDIVWSAIVHSKDQMVSVGFKPADEEQIDNRLSRINLKEGKWIAAKQTVLQMIYNKESIINPQLKIDKLEAWPEYKLPVTDVVIKNRQTFKMLLKSDLVRYVEPMSYEPSNYEKSAVTVDDSGGGSGCGGYTGMNNLQEGDDYSVIAPGCKISWNYSYHFIQNAWAKSTGAGIKVMVIDTGVSPDQENLGSDVNQGYSSGRTIQKIYTLPGVNSANDLCGHGTTMTSTVGAPRGIDGNSCGVAYNADLLVCKAVKDVLIDESSEIKGVADAYTYAADDATVKITSMSVGRLTSSSQIRDAIEYAYEKGKLMFCAGGTSFSFTSWFVGVIFPASLPQVEAVTGIKNKSNLVACDDCHKGKQIDFVTVMEKTSDGLHALANAISGDVPTIVGGSSVATSTAAGIAALTWSRFPTYTKDQVLQKLITTSSNYPNKTGNYGYGKLNADLATN